MKNKYTFWLILLALLSSSLAFSQTNPTNMVGAWQQKDTVGGKVVQFRNSSTSLGITKVVTPATLKDSLKNYAQIQDGLISGGEATLGVGSVTIDTAIYRINKVQYTSFNTVFSGIANSPSGTQYYLVVYGEIGGTLDTISGARDTIAVLPTIPANTVKINTILVGDGGVESATPDLSGFALKDGTGAYGNWNINALSSSLSFDTRFWKGQAFSDSLNTDLGNLLIYDNTFLSWRPTTFEQLKDKIGYASSLDSGLLKKEDWITFNSKQDLLTNPITGTGTRTINTLPKFGSNTNQIQNSNISDDGSTVLVNSDLRVISNTGVAARFEANSSDAQFRLINTASGGIIYSFGSGTPSAGAGQGLYIFDETNAAARFKINANGNVGIGITNPTSLLHVNGLARATGFGAGIAPSANHYLTTAANTSTIGSWLWTPSSTDYTGTVSGTFYNNANELKFYDGTISGTNRLVKLRNNQSLSGSGTVGVISNNAGDISTVPIADRLIAGEVQTSANRTLTLTDFGTNGTLTVYCNTTGGDVTITLPSVSDMRYLEVTIIKVTAGNNVIISGSANINGSASISESAQYKSYTLVSNGTQYYIKGERP